MALRCVNVNLSGLLLALLKMKLHSSKYIVKYMAVCSYKNSLVSFDKSKHVNLYVQSIASIRYKALQDSMHAHCTDIRKYQPIYTNRFDISF